MKRLKIVHLDDHKLLVDGIKKYVIKSRPDIEFDYTDFRDSDSAFEYISACIKNGVAPDLIITDFIHIGVNGYEFAKMVRAFERKNKKAPLPILLLTLVNSSVTIIKRGLKEKKFNGYISLADHNTIGLIGDFIDTNCQPRQAVSKI